MSPEVPISADDTVRSISTTAGVANLCALRWLGQEKCSPVQVFFGQEPFSNISIQSSSLQTNLHF